MPDRASIAVILAFPVALVLTAAIVGRCDEAAIPLSCLRIQAADLTDGDSARISGQSYRLTGQDAPLNAPETKAGSKGRAGAIVSEREAMWGARATAHGRKLLAEGGALCPTGKTERYGRALAVILLPDGRDYAAVMVKAGLATATKRREHDHWNAKKR